MKTDIHPEYMDAKVTCACGRVTETRATVPEIHVDICSHCHPFFTGRQKLVDTAGRVERFRAKYGNGDRSEETDSDDGEAAAEDAAVETEIAVAEEPAAVAAADAEAPEAAADTEAPEATAETEAPEAAAKTEAPEATADTEAPEAAAETEAPEAAAETEALEAAADTEASEADPESEKPSQE